VRNVRPLFSELRASSAFADSPPPRLARPLPCLKEEGGESNDRAGKKDLVFGQDGSEDVRAEPSRRARSHQDVWCRGRLNSVEPTELPPRSPDRGPPYWASTILRRKALGYHDA
jgi:hypothetical protein